MWPGPVMGHEIGALPSQSCALPAAHTFPGGHLMEGQDPGADLWECLRILLLLAMVSCLQDGMAVSAQGFILKET